MKSFGTVSCQARTRILLLVSLAVGCGSIGRMIDAEEPIRVMSFNIRYGTANDGDNHWNKRHPLVLKTIQEFRPDLLGTQEVMDFQAEYLRKHLEGYLSVGRSREKDPNRGEQCTIFYDQNRFAKLEWGQFWLSKTPDEIASKSWDSSLPRIATWIRLRDRKSEREFVFLNTHFDHRGKLARLESARLIAKQVPTFSLPVIISGDFNCPEGSPPYNVLTKTAPVKIVDSYRQVWPNKSSREGTFNGFRGIDNGARIDWILFTAPFHCESASIIRFQENNRYPSDHFPVTAILQFSGP